MLVLSRQLEESIMIGDEIFIKVVDIRGDKVRLGIVAPTEIPVHRQEVYEAIMRQVASTSSLEEENQTEAGEPPPPRGTSKPGAKRAKRGRGQ